MALTKIKVIDVNCATGETSVRDMTAEEIAHYESIRKADALKWENDSQVM
jgi:hypothetical protein